MLQGFTVAENEPFGFLFGYPKNTFFLARFRVIEGVAGFTSSSESSRQAGHAGIGCGRSTG
jgi:hypothetical protein